MKKPLFDIYQRETIIKDNSLSASVMRLYIARKHFEKSLCKSYLFKLLEKICDWLSRLLAKNYNK